MAEKKSLVQEFKEFIATGDLVKIAVAFILGGAISAVVASFVKNIAMGVVGLFVSCKDIVDAKGEVVGKNCSGLVGKGWRSVLWGDFLNDLVGFVLIAIVIFLLVKAYRKMVPEKPEAPAGPSEVELLTEIRDSLRSR